MVNCHKIVKGLSIGAAVLEILLGIIVLALFAKSIDGADFSCSHGWTGSDAKCSDRTAGMGIFTSFVAIFVGVAAIAIYFFLNHGAANLIGKLSLAGVFLFLWLFFLISWALMAKDLSDFKDKLGGSPTNCSLPPAWEAATAFGVFAWLNTGVLVLLSVASWWVGRDH